MADLRWNPVGSNVGSPGQSLSIASNAFANVGRQAGSILDQMQRQEQQKIANKRASDLLSIQQAQSKRAQAQEGRAVDKASREEAARQAKEEIAKTVIGVDRYGQAGILTPEVTQVQADKVRASNKDIMASQEAAGRAYEDSFNRNLAELQAAEAVKAATPVMRQVNPASSIINEESSFIGSPLGKLLNKAGIIRQSTSGQVEPTTTVPGYSEPSDELITQAAEIANRESGIMNVQDTAVVPKVSAATYGDRPLLGTAALKQAQIDAVLTNPDIPDSMKAEYIMSANKGKTVKEQELELKKQVEAHKMGNDWYKRATGKSGKGVSDQKKVREIVSSSGNPEHANGVVQAYIAAGKTYGEVLDILAAEGSGRVEDVLDSPRWLDLGRQDILLGN